MAHTMNVHTHIENPVSVSSFFRQGHSTLEMWADVYNVRISSLFLFFVTVVK